MSRVGDRRVDTLDLRLFYPAARFTEPGDVVFCTTPRVAAWVDHEGGSVVPAPPRIVRAISSATPTAAMPPLLPDSPRRRHQTAGRKAETQFRASEGFGLATVADPPGPTRPAQALAETLAAIERERDELRARLERLDALGAARDRGRDGRGASTITSLPTSPAAYAAQP